MPPLLKVMLDQQKRPHLAHPKYRPDIDGLRAVAILAVVLFHAFPGKMPGGFIGVDIFFVISGFLISTIIFSSLEQDRFSLVEFYVRRIRRIFPALIVVLLTSLVVGWFILFADEYKQLGKHTAASAAFIQNFILWRESGYFDNAAETKPLLHLWSLAIEEQFYVFWPLLLAFLWKRQKSFLKITAAIGIASFATNIWLMRSNPTAAFFLPITRFWELMTGGGLAYIVLHRPQIIEKRKNIQSALGFLLLIISLLLLNKERDFPGFWALIPTLGAFFVISAGPDSWLNQKLLSNKLMVGIGLISYPLYLWHWMLLSYLSIQYGLHSWSRNIAAILCAVFLSLLTYFLIEKKVRYGKAPNFTSSGILIALGAILISGIGIYKEVITIQRIDEKTQYVSYFDNRLPEWKYFIREHVLENYRSDCDWYDLSSYRVGKKTKIPVAGISKSCLEKDNSHTKTVMLWGDSHAQQLYIGLKDYLLGNWQILLGVSSGCAPNPDVTHQSTDNYCEHSNWSTMNAIAKNKPDVVIVAQVKGHTLAMMNKIKEKLNQLGVSKIIFTGPVPQWSPDLNKVVARKLWESTPRRSWLNVDSDVVNRNRGIASGFIASVGDSRVKFANLIDFFCNNQGCLIYLGDDKKTGLVTFDYGHLSKISSDELAKNLLVQMIIELDSAD